FHRRWACTISRNAPASSRSAKPARIPSVRLRPNWPTGKACRGMHAAPNSASSRHDMTAWLNQVYCEDALQGLARIPDGSVDLILVDPPYNLGKDYGNDS